MKALITGASSGIGKDIAFVLSKKGYDLILVARSKKELEKVKNEIETNVKIIDMDLSVIDNCFKLYEMVESENIDILINNAGFGLFGEFTNTSLDREINMIDLNIKAVHILTKLFLSDFIKRDNGYILNVASSAAFEPGPLMATYYATKVYVLHLTEAVYEELRKRKSNVYIGALCPGPVDTNFNKTANVEFSLKGLKSYDVAQYAVNKMLSRKLIIVPGILMKLNVIFNRFLPRKLLLKCVYYFQRKKGI